MSDNESETGSPSATQNVGPMKKLILFNNVRVRLLEQLYLLDIKAETHSYLINELSDYFRHRGLSELEHSRSLESILSCFQQNHTDKTKKGNLSSSLQSSYSCWQQLISETQSLSQDYIALSDVYNNEMMLKLQKVLQIYRKYHELVCETHGEVLRILNNFYTTITTYNNYQKSEKCSVDKLEALKARDIYKHYTSTSDTTLHKYMCRDLKDIFNSIDLGFCLTASKAILANTTSDHKQYHNRLHGFEDEDFIKRNTDTWNWRKQFLEKNSESVMKIKKSSIQEPITKENGDSYVETLLHFEFELQMHLLKLKEKYLRKNLENINGTLDSLETNFTNLLRPEDNKTNSKNIINKSAITAAKQFSFKNSLVQKSGDNKAKLSDMTRGVSKKGLHRPKLFGGSLEEYLKITNEQIPLIMRSCIRVINLYGLHSQGIFRVSGSQVEILNFRESFERGEDPLAGASDASDMNSVAGVLKLYLRELQEPLFPCKYFNVFLSLIQMETTQEIVGGMKQFFKNIPKPILIVIRFLFSFLNHLSEFASENMMDAFNLAVSFGPTLMPAPEDRKQVQYQTQLNDLIKVIIIHHQEVFPKDLGGPIYQKCMAEDYLRDPA